MTRKDWLDFLGIIVSIATLVFMFFGFPILCVWASSF